MKIEFSRLKTELFFFYDDKFLRWLLNIERYFLFSQIDIESSNLKCLRTFINSECVNWWQHCSVVNWARRLFNFLFQITQLRIHHMKSWGEDETTATREKDCDDDDNVVFVLLFTRFVYSIIFININIIVCHVCVHLDLLCRHVRLWLRIHICRAQQAAAAHFLKEMNSLRWMSKVEGDDCGGGLLRVVARMF